MGRSCPAGPSRIIPCLVTCRPRPPTRSPGRNRSIRQASTLPQRTESFTKLTNDHVKHLRSLVSSPSSVLSTLDDSASPDDLKVYNNDWMNKYRGKSQVVVKPRTTEEVSKIISWCSENEVAVVPQGGNTGLVGQLLPSSSLVGKLTECQAAQYRCTTNSSYPFHL